MSTYSLKSHKPGHHSMIQPFVMAFALIGMIAATTLTGCGIGQTDSSVASTTVAGAMTGHILGGPNPVIGATVKVYTTGNSDGTNGGYGVATMREEANAVTNSTGSGDTDNNGFFSFAGGYSCPTGQFVYLVSAGGNTGASTSATGATATANLSGSGVGSITVTNGGSGYLSATVTINSVDSVGAGATATAVVTGGVVTAINVTNAGSGYDAAPTVTISNPTTTNGANTDAVLVAPLGRCDDLFAAGAYTGQPVVINELTTIGAAYALGAFSSVSGSGPGTVVNIGAPAANNAAEVSGVSTGCVAGVGSCTTTATAGLAHAFLNYANLINYAAPSSAYANLPGDSAAIVPQQLINTIGNILVSCVNSAGGGLNSGVSDGSACGTIFAATTLPAANTPAYTTSTPSNTFTAMVNLAANPTLSGSGTAVASLYGVANSFTSVYQPALTSATGLNDFSVGIVYPDGLGAVPTTATAACGTPPCQGLIAPVSGALDINDIYYVGNESKTSGQVPVNLFSFSSNGNLLSTTSNGATLKYTLGLSVDALGNGYFGNGSGSGSNALGVFTTSGGILSQYTIEAIGSSDNVKVYSTAVDKANNVWAFGAINAGTDSLYMSPEPATTASFVAEGDPGNAFSTYGSVVIDPNQNVWTAAGTTLSVLQNTSATSTPSYNATDLLSYTTTGSPVAGLAFTGTASAYTAYVAAYKTVPGVQPYVATIGGNCVDTNPCPDAVTVATAGTNVAGSSDSATTISGSYFDASDGLGNLWLGDANSESVIQFNPNAGNTAYRYEPCLGGSTSCTSVFAPDNKPTTVSIDSAGSIWVTAPNTSTEDTGAVVQIIGAAAPAWPLLSLGLIGAPGGAL